MWSHRRALALALCLSPSWVVAATLTVGPGKQFSTLHAAIGASAPRDTILVDPGLYREDVDFRGKSVVLKSTGGADATTIAGSSYAIYMHTGETTDTRVEGFTLTSAGSYTVRIEGANPTIRDCIVRDAKAGRPYAAYFSRASVVLDGVSLTGNKTTYNLYATGSTLTLVGASFTSNTNDRNVYATGSTLDVRGVSFADNVADHGGGLFITGASQLSLSDAVFSNNQASIHGGSIYVENSGPITIEDFSIIGGAAAASTGGNATYGGAVFLKDNTDLVRLSGGHIANHYATYGGGIYAYNTRLHVSDVAFADNAADQGGDVYLDLMSRAALVNNTFVLSGARQGGAVYLNNNSDVLLLQNIFSQSTRGSSLYAYSASARSVAWYNLFYDNHPSNVSGTAQDLVGQRGNLQGDPLLTGFVDDGDPSNDDFTPGSGSPAIDAGSGLFLDADLSPSDIGVGGGDEAARPVAGDLVVSPCPASGELSSLARAIAAATSGQRIVVYPGIEFGDHDLGGKNVEIVSAYGPATAVIAGANKAIIYDSGEDARSLLEGFTLWTGYGGAAATWVSGALPRLRSNHFRNNFSDAAAYVGHTHGLSAAEGVEVSGCLWEDNHVTSTLKIQEATVDVVGSVFFNNQASFGGGIAALAGASVTVRDSVFESNQAQGEYGGGIYAVGADWIEVQSCQFSGNDARYGGGMYASGLAQRAQVTRSEFSHNSATYGAGIYLSGVLTRIVDSTFIGNSAQTGGGVAIYSGSSVEVLRSNLTDNEADYEGGAVYASASSLSVADSVLSFNEASRGGGLYAALSQTTLSGSSLGSNQALRSGGAIYSHSCDDVYTSNVLQGNSAEAGGAAYVDYNCRQQWINNTLVESQTFCGGALQVVGSAALTAVNNVVAHSTIGSGFFLTSGAVYELRYNDLWQNKGGAISGAITTMPATNLAVDPEFVACSLDGDPGNDDLHLASGSPLIDAGDPTLLDVDASRSDIGAYGGVGAPTLDDLDTDGYSEGAGDCDDNDGAIHPGAPELHDGEDNNCDGQIDEGTEGEATPGTTPTPTPDGPGEPTFPNAPTDAPAEEEDTDAPTDEPGGTDEPTEAPTEEEDTDEPTEEDTDEPTDVAPTDVAPTDEATSTPGGDSTPTGGGEGCNCDSQGQGSAATASLLAALLLVARRRGRDQSLESR